jgi:hypothetical protein
MHRLHLLVLFLQSSLHVEVSLPLFLYSLLLHISNNPCMHCLLQPISYWCFKEIQRGTIGLVLTAFSAFCWKWTKKIVLTAKSEVPARVSFAARDILERRLYATGIQMKVSFYRLNILQNPVYLKKNLSGTLIYHLNCMRQLPFAVLGSFGLQSFRPIPSILSER